MAMQDRCSRRSEAAGESLAGTASTFRRWMLVEHPGPWGRQGLLDARLPPNVGSGLLRLETVTGARVLLIRRPDRRPRRTVRCFAVDTLANDPWSGRIELDRIEDVLDLDPTDRSMFAEPAGPLAVVCTHGRRDPCCAERGRPLAQATAAKFPGSTWESTHIGGDRFAGNLVAFPHGLFFGRVDSTNGPHVFRRYVDGKIALEWFRGRSGYPMPVQAAEVVLRRELGLDGIDDVALLRSAGNGARATAVFATTTDQAYEVVLDHEIGVPARLTCHADDMNPPPHWVLRGIELLA